MTTSEVGASMAQTAVPGAQRSGAKIDSGVPADVFAALLGMVGLTPAPASVLPASPKAQTGQGSHAVRQSNSASAVAASLTARERPQGMPGTAVKANRAPLGQPALSHDSAAKPEQAGVEQSTPVRTSELQAQAILANGRHEATIAVERPTGQNIRATGQRESNSHPIVQPQLLQTGKPALQTQAFASVTRPSGAVAAMANPKPTGATPLSVVLARSGVPTSEVTNVTFVKHPVTAMAKHAVSTEAWRLQHGGTVPAPMSDQQSKNPSAQLLDVSSVAPHVHSTAPAAPEAVNSDTAQWSVLNADAHRQFAALLAQHTARADGGGTLTVQVHPQGLGTITVTVAQQPSGLSVQIQAANMQTAQWLQTETQRLTQAVQMAGIPVTGVQVGLPDSGTGDSRNQNSGTDRRSQSFGGRKAVIAAVAAPGIAAASSGTDLTAQSISVRA